MGPITTSIIRVAGARAEGRESSSRGKNPASSTLRSGRQGKISGKRASGPAASTEACSGACQRWPKSVRLCFRRFRRDEYRGPVGGATFDPVKGGGLTALHLEAAGRLGSREPSSDPPRPVAAQPSRKRSRCPGVVFSGSLTAHIRAFGDRRRESLWDFDTAKDYAPEWNPGQGRLTRRSGPVRCGRMIFVNSGYPRNGGMPATSCWRSQPEIKKFSGRRVPCEHSNGGPEVGLWH